MFNVRALTVEIQGCSYNQAMGLIELNVRVVGHSGGNHPDSVQRCSFLWESGRPQTRNVLTILSPPAPFCWCERLRHVCMNRWCGSLAGRNSRWVLIWIRPRRLGPQQTSCAACMARGGRRMRMPGTEQTPCPHPPTMSLTWMCWRKRRRNLCLSLPHLCTLRWDAGSGTLWQHPLSAELESLHSN